MREHEVKPAQGSKKRAKRIGRGVGSGHGTYACRGLKGQKARSGGGVSPRFEGGQTPLVKRLPTKRGFTNIFRVDYAAVNAGRLARFERDAEVTPQALVAAGLVKSLKRPIKILGQGELSQPLVVRAHRFSAQARRKIEAAGGRAEEIKAGGEVE